MALNFSTSIEAPKPLSSSFKACFDLLNEVAREIPTIPGFSAGERTGITSFSENWPKLVVLCPIMCRSIQIGTIVVRLLVENGTEQIYLRYHRLSYDPTNIAHLARQDWYIDGCLRCFQKLHVCILPSTCATEVYPSFSETEQA